MKKPPVWDLAGHNNTANNHYGVLGSSLDIGKGEHDADEEQQSGKQQRSAPACREDETGQKGTDTAQTAPSAAPEPRVCHAVTITGPPYLTCSDVQEHIINIDPSYATAIEVKACRWEHHEYAILVETKNETTAFQIRSDVDEASVINGHLITVFPVKPDC